MDQNKIYGLVISAGLSGRMGKFKPLLSYKGKSFIRNIVLKLDSVCDKIIIVTGYNASLIEENINELKFKAGIEFVNNENYAKGMFTSLQTGLTKAIKSDWIIYHFADQPGLPEVFYKEFIKQIDDEHNWIQPEIKSRKGHPILIHKSLFDLINNASDQSSLRDVSKNPVVKKKYWECDYSEIFQDIDTVKDYYKLKILK